MTPEQIQQLRKEYNYDPSSLKLPSQGDASNDKVSKRLKDILGEQAPQVSMVDTFKTKLSDIGNRQTETIQNSARLYKEGKQGILPTVGQTLGASIGAAGESFALPVNEAASAALSFVGEYAPESIKNAATDLVQKGIELNKTNIEAYNALPDEQKANVKGVTDLLGGVLNLSVGAGAVKGIGELTTKGLETATKKGTEISASLAKKQLEKAGQKEMANALSAITPDLTNLPDKEYQKLLSIGKVTPRKGVTGKPEYILSEQEIATAEKFKNVLQSKDPAQNVIRIGEEVKNMDTTVGDFLRANNGIFNKGELRNSLTEKLKDITDLTIDEKRLEKLKKTTIDNFVNGLQKNDQYSLWKARKEFDRKIETAFKGSPSVQKDMKKAFRNAVQDFISEKTPDGVYKATMKDMSDLINIQSLLADKASIQKGLNALQAWAEANPTKADAIKWLIGGGVAGYGLNAVLNN